MTDELATACVKAMHVVTADGKTLRAGRATLYILRHTGWGWFATLLSWPPLVWFAELGYLLVSRNRGFFSKFMFRKE